MAIFSDDEMTVLLSLARPIAPEQRPQFIDAVAAAIEARGGPSGPGVVHQVGRLVQRNRLPSHQTRLRRSTIAFAFSERRLARGVHQVGGHDHSPLCAKHGDEHRLALARR
jgi:hypothetical protein